MIRFVKRAEVTRKESIGIRVLAVLCAFLVISLFLLFLKLNPLEVYGSMLKGAFGTVRKFRQTIVKAVPLAITALGISVAFKMKFWNIGGEGQIMMGAFAASFVALKIPGLPTVFTLPLMMVAGIIGGGLWALIPAILKSKLKTNETIITLMMNYIALNWLTYLQYGPWKDPNAKGFAKIAEFPETAILPKFLGVHIGWVIAIVLVIVIYIFLNHTKKGYEISVLGESEKTALYAGININKTIVISMLVSGGLCGLAGMIQASAVSNTLSTAVTGGAGNTGIIIAWLSQLNSFAIMIVSVVFAALLEGGAYIQTTFKIPEAVALIIQSTILIFVLGCEYFIRFKMVFEGSKKKKIETKELRG